MEVRSVIPWFSRIFKTSYFHEVYVHTLAIPLPLQLHNFSPTLPFLPPFLHCSEGNLIILLVVSDVIAETYQYLQY